MNKQLYKFVGAIGLFLIHILVGILGYVWIEEYSLGEAFYMTVLTISTVGFNEVKELSEDGRLFTSIYILVNLAIFAYIISVLTSYIFEGRLKQAFRDMLIDRRINQLRNHVIVCGYGRNGSEACQELLKEGRDVVIIENNPEVGQKIKENKDIHVIVADATLDEHLKMAGIERAADIIITTSSDASNVFITLTSRELNPNIRIVSRASQVESESKLYRAGVNHVIMPDQLGGLFMANMITKPAVIEFLDLLTGRGPSDLKFHLESISYEDLKPGMRDKTLQALNIQKTTGATVIAVKDNEKGMIPNPPGETFIGKEDTLVLLCSERNVDRVFRTLTNR